MTYMRSSKSHRLTSHTWLCLNPQIGRPLSRIVTLTKLGCTRHMTLYIFKIRLTKIRDNMPQKLVRIVCMSIEKRCQAVVKLSLLNDC
jgi:hypothetical protein